MIKKISGQWDGVEKEMEGIGGQERKQLQAVALKVNDVRQALHSMCKASVTRSTLKDAVREAVLDLIQERGDELFSGLTGLPPERAEAQPDFAAASADQVAEMRESVERLSARLDVIEAKVGEVDSSFDDRLGGLQLELSEMRSTVEALGMQVGDELEVVSDMMVDMEDNLGQLRDSVAETAKAVMSEAEVRLRKEISEMMEKLAVNINEMKGMLGKLEETVPTRGMVEDLGQEVHQRLGGIEKTFEVVSGQVERIESTTPEIRNMGTHFKELRQQADAVQQELGRNIDGVAESRSVLAGRLDELAVVLQEVISRWESDQSATSERLSQLRDSLRDQLGTIRLQVEGDQKGFWNKLRGNKDPGLKLSAEDSDALSGKLEGIISGLEMVISKKD